jgi:hypothetical protein
MEAYTTSEQEETHSPMSSDMRVDDGDIKSKDKGRTERGRGSGILICIYI